MATIDDKQIIQELLLHNGYYGDDPQVAFIYSYINDYGNPTNSIFYPGDNFRHQINEFKNSSHVHNPQLLWTNISGLKAAGADWLQDRIDELRKQAKLCKP